MISVVMPIYNEGKTIKAKIEDILNQNYDKFEVIAVNDCSIDNTLKELDIKHPKLKVVSLEINKGPGGARNAGIKAVDGDLILYLDSDVTIYPDLIKGLDKWIRRLNHPLLAGIEAKQLKPEGFWQRLMYYIPNLPGNTKYWKDGYYPADFAGTTCSLWKKKVIEECGYHDELLRLGDDIKLAERAKKLGYKFFLIPVGITHQYRKNIISFLKEQFWYGVGGALNWSENSLIKIIGFIFATFIGIYMCIKQPIVLMLPFLLYAYRSGYCPILYSIPLLLIQYIKHIFNALGLWWGILLGKRAFNLLKGRH